MVEIELWPWSWKSQEEWRYIIYARVTSLETHCKGFEGSWTSPSNSRVIIIVGSGEIHVHWIEGQVNKGHLIKRKQGIRSQPSDPIGKWYQQTKGIAGNQFSCETISQGRPTIQTMVSPRGYISTSGELWGEKRVTPNHLCVPPQIERHTVMWLASARSSKLWIVKVVGNRRSIGGHTSIDHVLRMKAL